MKEENDVRAGKVQSVTEVLIEMGLLPEAADKSKTKTENDTATQPYTSKTIICNQKSTAKEKIIIKITTR